MKLTANDIKKYTDCIKPQIFGSVGSTNDVAINLAKNNAQEGETVVALHQTAGKGRLGRSFISENGGIYFSVILKPKIAPKDTIFITVAAAVAVCRAIESVSGKKCDIKWVNDIYIDGKKVCGILTEGGFNSDGGLQYAVLGIGINLFATKKDFLKEVPIASTVFSKNDKILFKKTVIAKTIGEFANCFFEFYDNLLQKEYIDEYRDRSVLDGKKITYLKDGKNHNATVLEINENAELVVECDGETVCLSTGEVRISGAENLFEGKV